VSRPDDLQLLQFIEFVHNKSDDANGRKNLFKPAKILQSMRVLIESETRIQPPQAREAKVETEFEKTVNAAISRSQQFLLCEQKPDRGDRHLENGVIGDWY